MYTQTGYLYTRWGNPTVDAAADVIARLEGAKGTLLFASGCAAITTSLLAFAKAGDHIVSYCANLTAIMAYHVCMHAYAYLIHQ